MWWLIVTCQDAEFEGVEPRLSSDVPISSLKFFSSTLARILGLQCMFVVAILYYYFSIPMTLEYVFSLILLLIVMKINVTN